jgi:hypothetical protein
MSNSIFTAVMEQKRAPRERIIEARVTKTHITRRQVHSVREKHPAARPMYNRATAARRIDVTPLPGSSLTKKLLDARFARQKSTWRSIVFGFLEQEAEDERFLEQQEKFRLGDVQMGNTPFALPLPLYEEMDCGYYTMDQHTVFNMTGGMFGSLPTSTTSSPSSSSSNANTHGSSTGSGGTTSTFGISTFAVSMGSQSSAAALNGFVGAAIAGGSKPFSPDVEMTDAPDVSISHVVIPTTVPAAPTPALPTSQPPQPVTSASVAPVAPLLIPGLSYLPSKPLPTEKAVIAQPAPAASTQILGLGYLPSRPLPTEKAPTPRPAPTSQRQAVAMPPSKPLKSIPEEETPPPTPSPPRIEKDAPANPPRAKLIAKARVSAIQVAPKDASKNDVELGMGAFSPAKINSSDTLVSAFSNAHFKTFFADEMETLKTSLRQQKEIRGSHLVFLNRSLKWVIDGDEAKWFIPDIDLESDDVADWRGKLNVFVEALAKVVEKDAAGVAADTRAKILKVFAIFAAEDKVNEEFRKETLA